MESTVPKRSLARLALAANILIALASLFATLAAINLALFKPLLSFVFATSLFALATVLLLYETAAIVRRSRTGSMPVAMSPQRPLGLVSLAIILIASLLFLRPFVGIVTD